MIKVLFVFNHPAPYKVRLLNELAKFLDLTVIFERNNNSDREKAFYFEKQYNFKVVHIKGLKIGREGFVSFGVKKHIRNNKYDLVIMNGYSHIAEMIAINFLKKNHIQYCFYINGGFINHSESSFKRKLKTKYISGADFYMSPDENSNKYLEYYGANKNRIYNYPYSTIYQKEILTEIPSEQQIMNLRKEKGIYSKYVYVSCGQLIPRKNYLTLIKSWPKDINKLLLIIGDGKQRQEIENYIKDNPEKNIQLLGFLSRKEIFEYYRLANAFIFPSIEDIYGHVVNEALSQGLPIISSPKVNASLKLIENGVNGFIIDKFDSEELAKKLDEVLLLDKNESLKIAQKNTIELMAEVHKQIIDK